MQGKRVGFVPTMGALHEGHLSLVREARKNCDLVVVSIFVNPTQFNDPKDFDRYPRTVENDIALLSNNDCDVVFVPLGVSEIYPVNYIPFSLALGNLENVMEGKQRPGHFNGVINVVSRLFQIVEPDVAYFGLKDYQQFLVVDQLVKQKHFTLNLVGMPTARTQSGLARSSRNQLLNEEQVAQAATIYQGLQMARDKFGKYPVTQVLDEVKTFFKEQPAFELEYLELADGETLNPLTEMGEGSSLPMAFIAIRLGKIRLIDNILLKN